MNELVNKRSIWSGLRCRKTLNNISYTKQRLAQLEELICEQPRELVHKLATLVEDTDDARMRRCFRHNKNESLADMDSQRIHFNQHWQHINLLIQHMITYHYK